MKWTLDGNELALLEELCAGVCLQGGETSEKLVRKGLAVSEDGWIRSSIQGEVAMGFLEEQALDKNLLIEIELTEEPMPKKPKPRQLTVDDFC